MIVDLGCGNSPRGDINIDISSILGVIKCNLGFERIPLEDGVADKVTSYDFIEHVPFYIYLNKNGEKYFPMKFLFSEVLRILKHGGIFFIRVPAFPHSAAFQDPSHMSIWTEHTAPYLVGSYETGEFELIQNKKIDSVYLEIIYKKK